MKDYFVDNLKNFKTANVENADVNLDYSLEVFFLEICLNEGGSMGFPTVIWGP